MSTNTEKFKSISPAEFFYRNKEIAGFANPARALYQSVRELVENALDATDGHGILPDIEVVVEKYTEKPFVYRISVKDNGIGIPGQYIPEAFGRIFFSSKYVLRQSRGLFGLGAKMVILYGQITVGEPAEVISATIDSKKIYMYRIAIDVKENKPIVLHKAVWTNASGWHGTMVRVAIEGDWGRSRQKILEYVRRTAIVTPYANITFKAPEGDVYVYPRVVKTVPPPPRETKPHPHGVDLEMLKTMVSETRADTLLSFLALEFQGVGEVTARRFTQQYGFDPDKSIKELTPEDIERLVKALKEFNEFKKPRAEHLSPIGADLIKIGLKEILRPEFVEAVTRRPIVYEGHALIVEVGIGYGGAIQPFDQPMLLRYANKIPLLYDEKSDVAWKVVSENIDWRYYGIEFPAPLAVLVHVCGTKIPYKGVGKESIADVPILEQEIEEGVRYVTRALKLYLMRKQKEEETLRKAYTIIKYIPEISSALAVFAPANPEKIDARTIEGRLFEMVKSRYADILRSISSVKDVVLPTE